MYKTAFLSKILWICCMKFTVAVVLVLLMGMKFRLSTIIALKPSATHRDNSFKKSEVQSIGVVSSKRLCDILVSCALSYPANSCAPFSILVKSALVDSIKTRYVFIGLDNLTLRKCCVPQQDQRLGQRQTHFPDVSLSDDKDNLAKILSLWLHVEALTPFDLDKNDLIEQMPGSLNQPRSSLFTWDNEDKTQRDSLEIELQKLPKEEDRTDFFRMFTVCIGIVNRNEFIDRAEHLLRSNLLDISQDLSDFSAEEQRTDDLICLGVLRANHFGKISMGTVEPYLCVVRTG